MRSFVVAFVLLLVMVTYLAAIPHAAHTSSTHQGSILVTGYPAPGNSLTVNGGGFNGGEKVNILYDTTLVGSAYATFRLSIIGPSIAAFRTAIIIPTATTTGAHTLKAMGQTSGITAQTVITVKANWSQFGFTSNNARYNIYETALGPSNVSQLTNDWTYFVGNYQPHPSATVVDGTAYFSVPGKLIALDAITGAIRWTASDFRIGNVPPAAGNGIVYTSGYGFQAWDSGTGQLLWSGNSQFSFQGSPTLAGGFVYGTDGTELDAFSAAGCGGSNCDPVWHTASNAQDPVAIANGVIYAPEGTHLNAYNASNGAKLWSGAISATNVSMSSPAVDGDYVFVDAGNDNFQGATYAFSASGCGAPTCSPLWSADNKAHYFAAPAIANGVVYVGSADWTLYAYTESGCGASTCSPLWSASLSGKVWSTPAVANGVVYVTAYNGTAYAFASGGCGQATCTPLWSYTVSNDAMMDSPVVVNGMLYVVSYLGQAYAFHLPGSSIPSRRR